MRARTTHRDEPVHSSQLGANSPAWGLEVDERSDDADDDSRKREVEVEKPAIIGASERSTDRRTRRTRESPDSSKRALVRTSLSERDEIGKDDFDERENDAGSSALEGSAG